ncbi:MAP3K7 [Lepeophtheirus salmonis]|uniref:GDP-Man:Man(1)GlcNAc(2)-PP-Dol alpha-1,3-mannosyltransferase n=2 Tax=Lepeophtheirus salmonis TaxID=72036 RepID=A0A7R8H1D5_LEPSM|nr:MAP3K7 [Lepeophtheirus salmonis]CAF2792365.1 MAP3K7 [Lepeophtheirus salmonis]
MVGRRVLFVHPDLGIGGAERLVVDAALALKTKGHQVTFLTAHHDPDHCFPETRDGSLSVKCVGDWLPRNLFGRFFALCAYLRMFFLSIYALIFYRSSIDTEVHCLKSLYRYPIDLLETWTTGKADLILVNSRFTREIFHKTFKSLKHAHPEVLYPSLNTFDFDSFDDKIEYQVRDDDEFVFLSLNRFERKKQVDLAIRALALVLKSEDVSSKYKKIKLIIAGGYDNRVTENVEYERELRDLAEYEGVSDHVSFLRSISNEKKMSLLKVQASSLIYTPSFEHFGIVPIEAMYCQVPVIAVDNGGPKESISNESTGYLVPATPEYFAEAMKKASTRDSLLVILLVMDDPELLRISLEDLTQGEIIGRGSFGTVIRALWNEEEVAVKFFQPDKELLDAFAVEANQLSRVNHRNIIRLFGASFQPPHVFLVMEYADSGSLYKVLHTSKVPYHSGHAIHWLLQTAKGVEYLHNLKPTPIAHRDLKSPNLLLVNGGMNLKLCDFGTACGVQTYMTNNKGSAAWMAPEVFEGNKYTEKCDIYSHGILTWEVLTRRLPFDEIKGNNCRILWAIHQGKRPPLISGCPVVLEDLMTKCWDKNPSVRPNMTKIVEQLSFIQKFFPSIENDPLQIEKFSSLKDEEELKEETGSYVSALTSLPSKSEGFYTPPELVDSDTDVIPPLPSMDPISLLNAPQELMKGINLWVDEDSGPIPSDIEVVRDRSSEDIVSPHPPSKDTFQFFEPPYRPNLYPYHGSHRYPLSDFRPSVIGVGASNLLSPPSGDPPETLSNHDSWHNNMPYESLSGRNYPSPSYFGKVSPQNLSSPHSMRRNNSKTTVTKDINGLFSVREDATEKSESFKKGK